ncbi:hypothetical protein GDO86_003166 [Hymenochirus boettgeri]|uniref:SMB domain-containing protein n=1 Tax=Hymenochirus boettgeri TaxID=247094 RepID=A0A8T2JZW1_9PIPI|nr:hypothetical protein GDO86_003166 [Hymenochirus boettgeri]
MRGLWVPALLLLLGAASVVNTAEEASCSGRCFTGYEDSKTCQCDILCIYYKSCCNDYVSVCKPKETRGDVFPFPEDESTTFADLINSSVPLSTDTTTAITKPDKLEDLEEPTDQLCSGKPFDAFTNLKNGSIYAFRGKYFYELDDKRALEGYPKLIKDVWGIDGPIDAALTRVNCQGKTYFFKGKQYWRFSDGILDLGYPRDISDGFQNIPDYIDATFALPANDYNGNEKAYFFKGKTMHCYLSGAAQSAQFRHYVKLQENSWEDFFSFLFGPSDEKTTEGPFYINKDWKGVPNGVDAVLPSRIYVPQPNHRSKKRKSHHRQNRRKSTSWQRSDLMHESIYDYDDEESDPDWLPPSSSHRCQPAQNVYFFKNDKYYRVNLQTKRVDHAYPRYPRSIAQYWLGCKEDDRKEKKRN